MNGKTLKLDYDGEIPTELTNRIGGTVRALRARVLSYSVRRTRRGYHVEVELSRRVPALAIVAAQAIAGSDPLRERFNLARVRSIRGGANAIPWNVLFQRKIPSPLTLRRS
jgi:hypothetical protein